MIAWLVAAALACAAPAVVAQKGPEPGPQPYNHWVQVHENAPFAQRAAAVSAYFPPTADLPQGRWLLMSGFVNVPGEEEPRTLSDVWTSDDVGVTWKEQIPTPFRRCDMAADVVTVADANGTVAHTLVVTGGLDFGNNFESFNDVQVSFDNGETFTVMTADAPWPRRHMHGLVTVNRTASTPALVLLGGNSFNDTHSDFLNDVWISYNLGADWTELPVAPWAPRTNFGVHATHDGSIFVAGGYGRVGLEEGLINDVWMSDPSVTSWTLMTAAASWAPRWGHSLKHHNGSLILIGGNDAAPESMTQSRNSEVWMSSDNGVSWHWVAVAQFGGRSDFMTAVIGDKFFVAGGEDDTEKTYSHVNNEIWYTSITPTPEPPAPSGGGGTHHDGKEIGTGGIVAIIVAAVAVIGLGAYFLFRRKKPTAEPVGGYHLQV